jgi:hypothetical protein
MPKMRRIGDRLKGQRERMMGGRKGRKRKIEKECAKGKYAAGCKLANQKWECLMGERGWKIGKCRRAKCKCEEKSGRKRRENDREMEEDEEEEEFLREIEKVN